MRSIWFVTFVREKMSSKGWEGFCSYQLFYLPEGNWPAGGLYMGILLLIGLLRSFPCSIEDFYG